MFLHVWYLGGAVGKFCLIMRGQEITASLFFRHKMKFSIIDIYFRVYKGSSWQYWHSYWPPDANWENLRGHWHTRTEKLTSQNSAGLQSADFTSGRLSEDIIHRHSEPVISARQTKEERFLCGGHGALWGMQGESYPLRSYIRRGSVPVLLSSYLPSGLYALLEYCEYNSSTQGFCKHFLTSQDEGGQLQCRKNGSNLI